MDALADHAEDCVLRCRSTQPAHATSKYAPRPNQARNCGLGGGADHGPDAHITVVTTMKLQKPHEPIRSTGRVARTYKTMPVRKSAPSTSNVATTEFHNPRPNSGDFPGHSGMSAACEK